MFMIQTVCSLCLALLLLMALPATAQENQWPHTFTGQPDFDFERPVIVKELEEKKKELGFEPFIATMEDLLINREIDPFTAKPRYRRSVSNKVDENSINPFLPSQLVDNEAITIGTSEDISLTGLPEYALDLSELDLSLLSTSQSVSETVIDVKDFENFLARVSGKEKLEFETPDLTIYDYKGEVQNLTLQSIVTSPVKYVVINNQRYSEGDQFTIPVKIVQKPLDIGKIIDKYMPSPTAVPAATFAQYVALRDQAIKQYETRAQKEGNQNDAGFHDVTVTIKAIEHRRIVISIFDRDYDLQLRLLL